MNRRFAASVGALLVLAACGSNDEPATSAAELTTIVDTTASTTPTTEVAATEPPATESPSTESPSTDAPTTALVPVPPASLAGTIGDVSFVDPDRGWVTTFDQLGTSATFATTDGGATWAPAAVPAGTTGVRFADATNGWAFDPDGVSSTHDGGVTWTRLPGLGNPSESAPALVVAGDAVIIATADADGVGLMTSPVDHDAFTPLDVHLPYGAGPQLQLSLAAVGSSTFLVYDDRVVAGSAKVTDGIVDTSWVPPAADQGGAVEVFAHPDGGPLWAEATTGIWGGDMDHPGTHLFVSDDGTSFTELELPLLTMDPAGVAGPFRVAVPEPGAVVVALPGNVTNGTVLARTDDRGASWQSIGTLPQASVTSLAFPAPHVAIASVGVGDDGHGELWRSDDAGTTWRPLAVTTP